MRVLLTSRELSKTGGFGYQPRMSKLRPESCKAARQLLGWKQADLARVARVSLATVKKYELDEPSIIPVIQVALERALEEAGVELIEEDGGGAGARLRRPRERKGAGR